MITQIAGFDSKTGRLIRGLRRRHNEHCIHVVTYHNVSPHEDWLTRGTALRHDPETFEQQMDYLAAHFQPLALRDVIASLRHGERLQRAVVVTFDDGYADMLRYAAPILYRRRIPATLFPVTSVIDNVDLMWQHKLRWLVLNGHVERVRIALGQCGFATCGPDEDIEQFMRMNYRNGLPDVLESILQSVGTSGRTLAGRYRPYLSAENVTQADPAFIEFGNHTHRHAVLSGLTIAEQVNELGTARDVIRQLAGYSPVAVAYPFGLKVHYTQESRQLAARTGHRAALDMRRRINPGDVDPFKLSRKPAPTESEVVFEQVMEDWPNSASSLLGVGT